MTVQQFKEMLNWYPDEMEVKIYRDGGIQSISNEIADVYSDTAFLDRTAPEDEWNHEDGVFQLGSGEPYLLLNIPIP